MPDQFSTLTLLTDQELADRERWLAKRLEDEIREAIEADIRISLVKIHAEQEHRKAGTWH